jgi:hypothetical protein
MLADKDRAERSRKTEGDRAIRPYGVEGGFSEIKGTANLTLQEILRYII